MKKNEELYKETQGEIKDSQEVFLESLNKTDRKETFRRIKDFFYMNELEDMELEGLLLEIKKKTKLGLKVLKDCYKKKRKEKNVDDGVFEEEENTDVFKSIYINEEKKMIAEQVFDGEKNQFCVYDGEDDKVTYKEYLFDGSKNVYPIDDEEIRKGAILLPSKIEDYKDDDTLDKDIKTFIKKWLDIPEDFLQFALWNIKRSWVFDKFHTLNYLRALGDTGQGKTRFLDALGSIHYKPIETSGATTAAPVFRIIDKWRGTLIMDEADFQKTDEAQDIIKIINMGYEQGKFVMRCDQNDAKKIDFFDPYCPKILATRKTFQDKAVESRCITQVMKGTSRKDIPLNLNEDFNKESLQIRNKLLLWRFRKYFTINTIENVDFDMGDLEPRIKQIVNSFISLFSDDKKKLEEFKVFIQGQQEEIIDERQNSFDGQVVSGIYDLVKDGWQDISLKDIIEKADIRNQKGNLVKPRGISSTIKSLGFGKLDMKRTESGTKRCLKIEEKHLKNLFKRYGFDCNDVTIVTVKGLDMGPTKKTNYIKENGKHDENDVFFSTTPKSASESLHRDIVTTKQPSRRQDTSQTKNQPKTQEKPENTMCSIVTEQIEEIIHQICSSCGAIESHYWDLGKPLCRDCYKSRQVNK